GFVYPACSIDGVAGRKLSRFLFVFIQANQSIERKIQQFICCHLAAQRACCFSIYHFYSVDHCFCCNSETNELHETEGPWVPKRSADNNTLKNVYCKEQC